MAVYNLQTVIGTTKTALQHQAGNPGDAAIADGYWSAGDGGEACSILKVLHLLSSRRRLRSRARR